MNCSDFKDTAAALLATVQKRLTGREIAACEWAKSGQMDEELDSAVRSFMRYGDDADGVSYSAAEKFALREFEELDLLKSLQTQFSREIGNWLNQRNANYSRKAVRA